MKKRLNHNDRGINGLDRACKAHDIAYSDTQSTSERNKADKILANEAWKRFRSSDASIGEKAIALGVNGIMNIKSKLGFGLKAKRGKKKKSRKKTAQQKKREIHHIR